MGRKRTRLYISKMPDTQYLTKKAQERYNGKAFGMKCAKEWHKLCKPYIPYDTGYLAGRVEYKPFNVIYRAKYAHYQYTGIVYEDPLYHVAGFLTPQGWKSRLNVKKTIRTIPIGNRKVNLQYKNPMATDHWDIAAKNAGKDKQLCVILNRYVNRGYTNKKRRL